MNARKKTARKTKSSRSRKRRLAHKQSNGLNFETLESRRLLATITVGNNSDLLSPTADTSSVAALIANDGGDGISLREAVAATNNTAGEDTITFDASVFSGGDSNLIRLTQGELEISESLTVDGSAVGGVVVTGDANGDDITIAGTHLTDVSASSGETAGAPDDLLDDNGGVLFFYGTGGLNLKALTITGGGGLDAGGGVVLVGSGHVSLIDSTVSGNSSDAAGGGVRTRSGDVSLANSTVSGNISAFSGGGIYSSEGSVSLIDSTVSRNSSDASGGGVNTNFGDVSVVNSAVTGNISAFSGGGIDSLEGSVSLIDSTVSGNISDAAGGGVRTRSGDVSLANSTVSGNISAFSGGGIDSSVGSVLLIDSTVSGNSSDASGGGVRTVSGDVSLVSSTVSGNNSGFSGGGVFTGSGSVFLNNSTVSGNSSGADGGGVWSDDSTVLLVNSTVVNNSAAGVGGGISLFADNFSADERLTIHNSIVAGNTDNGTAPDVLAVGDTTNDLIVEHSLIGNTTGSGITALTGTGNLLNQSAQLGPLSDNGGPTLTHALLPSSPAIDAGSNALAVNENGTPLTNDQLGEARIESGTVDVGAVEFDFVDPFLLGDVNQDGGVNFLDISPFISLLVSNSYLDEADINRDGDVDFRDIAPFISLLSGSATTSQPLLGDANIDGAVGSPGTQSSASVLSSDTFLDEPDVNRDENVSPLDTQPFVSVLSSPGEPDVLSSSALQSEETTTTLPQASLGLANDSASSPVAEASTLSTLNAAVTGATSANISFRSVAFVSVTDWSFGAGNSSSRGSESDDPLVRRRSPALDEARFDLKYQLHDRHRSTNVSIVKTFSTAFELFDADPESLDRVFDFELEETLAGLLEE